MDKYKQRFANIWRKSREDSKKSQSYIAKQMGINIKTVQNWEAGVTSPSQVQGFEWFQHLGVSPLPYYLEALYPSYAAYASGETDDPTETLIDIVRNLADSEKRDLLFCLSGMNGGSMLATLNLFVAYTQLPLRDRLSIARGILTDYKVSRTLNDVQAPGYVEADINLLMWAIERAERAVMEGNNGT